MQKCLIVNICETDYIAMRPDLTFLSILICQTPRTLLVKGMAHEGLMHERPNLSSVYTILVKLMQPVVHSTISANPALNFSLLVCAFLQQSSFRNFIKTKFYYLRNICGKTCST